MIGVSYSSLLSFCVTAVLVRCGLLQVVGPLAAQKWLAEARQALHLRYHFVHCREFDAHGGPARQWLMNMTGMHAFSSML